MCSDEVYDRELNLLITLGTCCGFMRPAATLRVAAVPAQKGSRRTTFAWRRYGSVERGTRTCSRFHRRPW